MHKDFNTWNKEKKRLEEDQSKQIVFHEREVWWCSIGVNVGDEQDGKHELFDRPVLVIRKFNNKLAWVLPMSSKEKEGVYYHSVEHEGKIFSIILSQLRLVSSKRFRRYVRKISHHQFSVVLNKLIGLLRVM